MQLSCFFLEMFQPPSSPLSSSTQNNFEDNAQNLNNFFEDNSEDSVPGTTLPADQESQQITAILTKSKYHFTFDNTYFYNISLLL